MALRVRAYGARRCLRDGFVAAGEGRLDDALAAMRAYFGLRGTTRAVVSASDADAAVLAATCAALRGDSVEFEATAAIVHDDSVHSRSAKGWIATLRLALAGDVAQVSADLDATSAAIPRALAPALILLAVERGGSSLDASAERLLRTGFGPDAPIEVRARVGAVLARVALARGDRAGAMAALDAVPADAPPLYRFLAGLAAGRAEVERRWADVPDADRQAAGVFAAAFAAGASTAVVDALLAVVGNSIAPATAATLEAELIVARVRDGHADSALEDLRSDPAAAPVLAAARAHALIAAGRSRDACIALASSRNEVGARDLQLLAAVGADDAQLVDELLAADRGDLPASEARAAIAAHLAARRDVPEVLPAWLDRSPDDAQGLYAWAVLETRRGRGATAIAAFARAVAARPELGAMGDTPDVAQLLVVRDALRANDLAAAEVALASVRSPRVLRAGRLFHAMLLVRRAASAAQLRVDAGSFGAIVRDLVNTLPLGSEDHAAVSLLAQQADVIRASWLLRQGRIDEARLVIGRLDSGEVDAAFLKAVLAILDGAPLDAIERELAAAAAAHGDDRLLAVMLAEVRGVSGGADARVAALEDLRTGATTDPLVDEALASAYGGARRGLDAKRVALEELRRRGALGSVLAAELRDALAFESPPRDQRRAAAPTEARTRRALAEVTIKTRAHLLVAHAQDVAHQFPPRRPAIEALLSRFKQALLSDELAIAAAVEVEVLAACTGGAM